MEFATEGMTGNSQFYQENIFAFPVALLLAAGVTFAAERLAFASSSGDHSLFFIPIKWWPLIIVAIAAITLVYRLIT